MTYKIRILCHINKSLLIYLNNQKLLIVEDPRKEENLKARVMLIMILLIKMKMKFDDNPIIIHYIFMINFNKHTLKNKKTSIKFKFEFK